MKKFLFTLALLGLIMGYAFFSCQSPGAAPAPDSDSISADSVSAVLADSVSASGKAVARVLLVQVDSFAAAVARLQAAAESPTPDGKQLKELFLKARTGYKTFEWAAEYFEPATSRVVNGAPVREVELSGQVFEPAGLQVIEGLLFPKADTVQKKELVRQLTLLEKACGKYKTHFGNIDMFDWQVFDAAKLEVFRIITLGITGFDDPLTQKSMAESAISLQSLQKMMAWYAGGHAEDLPGKFDAAVRYLTGHPDFNSFNRAEFITAYANPLSTGISDLESALKIHVIRYNRLLNQDAKTLFDADAFNINAYIPDPASFVTKEKIALGKRLFSDPVLSASGTRSCQSCHQPDKVFTDGLVKNTVLDNNGLLRRNTPTLINAALQPSQFYDLRVTTLEDQALNVVQNAAEMHGSMKMSVQRLWQDTAYRRLFSAAFPRKDRAGIDTLEVMNAIGSYVRSLVLLNSRWDDYMRGDKTALSLEELNGFNLFMGKAKCATCHYMPLFNGTFPPRYVKTESEVIGVPSAVGKKEIDGDMGRYDIIKVDAFKHAFKTSTVRNAARTAPYMHNGVFATLEQVMDFYNKGGGAGMGIRLPNQTLPFDKLGLTEKERGDIIAFIRSLDSR